LYPSASSDPGSVQAYNRSVAIGARERRVPKDESPAERNAPDAFTGTSIFPQSTCPSLFVSEILSNGIASKPAIRIRIAKRQP